MRRLPRPGPDALRAWLVSRAAVLALLALATYLQRAHGFGKAPIRPGATGFFVWDGDWYRRIGAAGYDVTEALRFFPLVALPGRLVSPLGAFAAGVVLLVVVNASALVYADGLARLTAFELKDSTAARWVPWLVLLNPASYVLVLGYAEATFGALAVWCFFALRRRAWAAAAVAAYLGGLARPVGLLLALPALVEAVRGIGFVSRRELLARAVAVAAAPLGAATYFAWVWATRGDPMLPFSAQQAHGLRSGVLSSPVDELFRAARWDGSVQYNLVLLWLPLALLLLVLVARRLPASYTVYAAAVLLLTVGTPRLASFLRYALAAFPLIMVAAAPQRRGVRVVTLVVCCCGLAGYSVLAFAHSYVP
ncbi:MAG TPA: hypothetical protein VNA20_00990 [Frankiaceae bacterium]|nr:hypothetical protein [Frankiaceae bacterium]